MKICFLGTGGYTGRVAVRGWPVPPELCDREEAARSMTTAIRQYRLAEEAGFDLGFDLGAPLCPWADDAESRPFWRARSASRRRR